MTYVEHRTCLLACDRRGCKARYGPAGMDTGLAALRKRAAQEGWTHVPSPRNWRYDLDYCPAHRENPAPARG